MSSDVFFCDINSNHFRTIFDNVKGLLAAINFENVYKKNEHVAVKVTFGEWGNLNYVRPQYVMACVDELKKLDTLPFLTDTNTLYAGMRTEAVQHISNAVKNGFGYESMQVPVIIADGVKGNNYMEVEVPGEIFKKVKIASDIYYSEAMLCISHFKLHDRAGYGGTLKNLSMGCAAKAGKIELHSDMRPKINQRCSGCGKCIKFCSPNAIYLENNKAKIYEEKCSGCGNCSLICPKGALKINWESEGILFQRKMAEYAYGAVKNKQGKAIFINFLTNITHICDCVNYTPPSVIGDLGIVASLDPVACDAASIEILNEACKRKGMINDESGDYITQVYPNIPWKEILNHAEKLGLGFQKVNIIKAGINQSNNRMNQISKALNKLDK